jgi:hypothetical protein
VGELDGDVAREIELILGGVGRWYNSKNFRRSAGLSLVCLRYSEDM